MVTKSSNPTAGSSERSTETQGEKESCLGEQLQGWAPNTSVRARERQKGFSFLNLFGTAVKHHLIQIHRAITLARQRESGRNNNWRRPLTALVGRLKVGRWSGWLVLIYYKGIFMLFELPSIAHVKQNCILKRQFIPSVHARAHRSCHTTSKGIWRKCSYVMPITKIFFCLIILEPAL